MKPSEANTSSIQTYQNFDSFSEDLRALSSSKNSINSSDRFSDSETNMKKSHKKESISCEDLMLNENKNEKIITNINNYNKKNNSTYTSKKYLTLKLPNCKKKSADKNIISDSNLIYLNQLTKKEEDALKSNSLLVH